MKVYAGTADEPGDPAAETRKTERAAQIELGKLLAMAQAGWQPDSDVTVAQLLDQSGADQGLHHGCLACHRRQAGTA